MVLCVCRAFCPDSNKGILSNGTLKYKKEILKQMLHLWRKHYSKTLFGHTLLKYALKNVYLAWECAACIPKGRNLTPTWKAAACSWSNWVLRADTGSRASHHRPSRSACVQPQCFFLTAQPARWQMTVQAHGSCTDMEDSLGSPSPGPAWLLWHLGGRMADRRFSVILSFK